MFLIPSPHVAGIVQWRRALAAFTIVTCVWPAVLTAQQPAAGPANQPTGQVRTVELTLPPVTELKLLIDYVSEELGIQFLYEDEVAQEKISVRAPQEIPVDTLLDILRSALKMKGFALVDADVKGWMKVVKADDLPRIAMPRQNRPIQDFRGTEAVTQTFLLSHMSPDKLSGIIKPFLSRQGANDITLPDQNLLIVTDYADNLRRIAKLIETIDQAGPAREIQFYTARHIAAGDLVKQLTSTLAARGATGQVGLRPVTISQDERTNQLMIVGTKAQIVEVDRLVKAFDVSLEQRTEIYSFQYIDAMRIDRLVKDILDPLTAKRLYRSAIDRDDNLLIATGTEAVHKRIIWLREQMDVATKRPSSGMKIYRLKYANAQDVLNTLRSVPSANVGGETFGPRRGVSALGRGGVNLSRNLGGNDSPIEFVPGPNTPDQPGEPSPVPPAVRGEPRDERPQDEIPGAAPPAGSVLPGNANVTVDENTNSLIVFADRTVQEMYAELIKALDRRRLQVMIEAKVVIIDTSDNFSLGVEVSGFSSNGLRRMFEFTSFGLSNVNPATGALSLIPGTGFNWTLVDPSVADAVIRALTTHRRAQVMSAPRILVNDNAVGTLASVTEVPFSSINASNTVATTSFAGFAEAGTTIDVKPRITDEDHLQLEFNVALNSFTQTGTDGVPPRQTDQLKSEVMIPDGYTIIAGGLTRRNMSQGHDGVPFLENIPILRELTSSYSEAQSQTTLFIFLRPVILRDDKFRDLKYLSDLDLTEALEPGNYPEAAPLLIK